MASDRFAGDSRASREAGLLADQDTVPALVAVGRGRGTPGESHRAGRNRRAVGRLQRNRWRRGQRFGRQPRTIPRSGAAGTGKIAQPKPGIACYHLYANSYECFKTDGFGLAAFNLGSGSGFSAAGGQYPHDRFYVGAEYRNRDSQPPAPPVGDTYYYGLPDGHHIDCTYSLRLMTG